MCANSSHSSSFYKATNDIRSAPQPPWPHLILINYQRLNLQKPLTLGPWCPKHELSGHRTKPQCLLICQRQYECLCWDVLPISSWVFQKCGSEEIRQAEAQAFQAFWAAVGVGLGFFGPIAYIMHYKVEVFVEGVSDESSDPLHDCYINRN